MMWGPGFRRQLGVITNSNKISDLRFFLPLNSDINYIRPNPRVQTFDGENDYVEIPDDDTLDFGIEDYSIEVSINRSLGISASEFILGKDGGGGIGSYDIFMSASGAIVTRTESVQIVSNSINLDDGNNHLILISHDRSNVVDGWKIYIDGNLDKTGAGNSTNLTNNVNLFIGKRGGGNNFNGNINYVKLYSDATQTNLVAYYDLTTSDLGVDQVKDLSGNGNHGTSFGKGEFTRTTPATFVDHNGIIGTAGTDVARFDGMRFINDDKGFSDKVGENAMVFDASNTNVITATNGLNLTNKLTVSCWLNIKSYTSFARFVINDFEQTNQGFIFGLSGTDARLRVTNTTSGVQSAVSPINLNENTMVTGVYDGSNVKIYINGEFKQENALTGDIINTASLISIGGQNGSNYLDGTIDNTIIWNTALTGEQVMQQYLFSKKGSDYLVAPENVVGAWKLDDTTSTIIDYSGNGNDGTFFSGGIEATPTLVEGVYSSDTFIVGNGIMIYEGGTNLFLNSDTPATQSITVSNATVYTLQVVGSGSITVSGGGSGTATDGSDLSFTTSSTSITLTVTGSLDRVMFNSGSFARPYISTLATTESTTADVYFNDVSDIITQGVGALYCEFEVDGINDGGFPYFLDLSDSTLDNRIALYGRHTTNIVRTEIFNATVQQVLINSANDFLTFNTTHKIMVVYKDNLVRFFADGVKIGEDTSVTIPTNLTTLNIGSRSDNANQTNGKIKAVKYYNNPDLSDATCIRLTQ